MNRNYSSLFAELPKNEQLENVFDAIRNFLTFDQILQDGGAKKERLTVRYIKDYANQIGFTDEFICRLVLELQPLVKKKLRELESLEEVEC